MGRIDCKNARTCGHNMCFEKACRNYAPYERTKPTNADRIRGMTDEELAHELALVAGWDREQYKKARAIGIEKVILDILQQPAEGD